MDRDDRLIESRIVNELVTEPLNVGREPSNLDFDPEEDQELELEGGLDELTEAEVQELEALAVAEHGTPAELEVESEELDELDALAEDEDDDEEGGV
jgi:hypothetical protein